MDLEFLTDIVVWVGIGLIVLVVFLLLVAMMVEFVESRKRAIDRAFENEQFPVWFYVRFTNETHQQPSVAFETTSRPLWADLPPPLRDECKRWVYQSMKDRGYTFPVFIENIFQK